MAKKVLIIDDYPATVKMMTEILQLKGYEIVAAYDGASGLLKARSEKPDLILLDIMMPEKSGFEVCRELKSDAATSGIPVIIVTIRVSEDSIRNGKSLGAAEYITKPFEPFRLLEAVEKHIG